MVDQHVKGGGLDVHDIGDAAQRSPPRAAHPDRRGDLRIDQIAAVRGDRQALAFQRQPAQRVVVAAAQIGREGLLVRRLDLGCGGQGRAAPDGGLAVQHGHAVFLCLQFLFDRFAKARQFAHELGHRALHPGGHVASRRGLRLAVSTLLIAFSSVSDGGPLRPPAFPARACAARRNPVASAPPCGCGAVMSSIRAQRSGRPGQRIGQRAQIVIAVALVRLAPTRASGSIGKVTSDTSHSSSSASRRRPVSSRSARWCGSRWTARRSRPPRSAPPPRGPAPPRSASGP